MGSYRSRHCFGFDLVFIACFHRHVGAFYKVDVGLADISNTRRGARASAVWRNRSTPNDPRFAPASLSRTNREPVRDRG
jgi:hypothetical protein